MTSCAIRSLLLSKTSVKTEASVIAVLALGAKIAWPRLRKCVDIQYLTLSGSTRNSYMSKRSKARINVEGLCF